MNTASPLSAELELFHAHLRLQGRSASTQRDYVSDIRRFAQRAAITQLADLDLEHVQKWDADLAKNNSPATRARYRNALRAFIAYAEANLGLPKVGGDIQPIFVPVHDPKLPTREEILLLLDAQRPDYPLEFRDAAVICLLFLTGIRRSEVVLLNLGDVSLNGTSFQIIVTSPKRGGQRRIVNFGNLDKPFDIAAAYFGKFFVQRITVLGGATSQRARNAPLFASLENPHVHLAPRTINGLIESATARVSGGVRSLGFITPHTLRHGFATYAAAAGMNILNIQHYMGHASISNTERYIHLAEKVTAADAREHGPMAGLKAHADLYMGNSDAQLRYFRTLVPSANS